MVRNVSGLGSILNGEEMHEAIHEAEAGVWGVAGRTTKSHRVCSTDPTSSSELSPPSYGFNDARRLWASSSRTGPQLAAAG
eukprot:scaffold36660_cov33-Tisochrysis_lutea.AAC.4